MKTVKDWYLVEASQPLLVGKVNNEHMNVGYVTRFLDESLIETTTGVYRLGYVDPIFASYASDDLKELLTQYERT